MTFGTLVTVLSIIFILVFLALIVFLFRKGKRIRQGLPAKKEEKREVLFDDLREDWQGVLSHLESANESDWKMGIMEADKLVDNLLIQKGHQGESMAERLTDIEKGELKSLDLLWEAHKTRNRIAHKPNFKLNRNEALRAVSYYEEALKEMTEL